MSFKGIVNVKFLFCSPVIYWYVVKEKKIKEKDVS